MLTDNHTHSNALGTFHISSEANCVEYFIYFVICCSCCKSVNITVNVCAQYTFADNYVTMYYNLVEMWLCNLSFRQAIDRCIKLRAQIKPCLIE